MNFSVKDISNEIQSLIATEQSMDLIGEKIEKTIRNKLVQSFPMLSMFLSDDMVVKVTNIFKTELRDFLIESSRDLSEKIEERLSIEQIVKEKVEAFSSDKLEEILNSIMKKEFVLLKLLVRY